MKRSLWPTAAALAFWSAAGSAPAGATVVFTGYADQRMTAYGMNKITGSAAVLSAVGVTETETKSTGFTLDALGFFASREINDHLDFLIDTTYRKVGYTTEEIRIQYAYLNYEAPAGWEVKSGKIPMPLGYFNENMFYPFERQAVAAPIFQGSILGLPIADWGVSVGKNVPIGGAQLSAVAYGVNGYGASNTAGTIFRPGLGSSGALLLGQNLKSTNTNDHLAGGGRLELAAFENQQVQIGGSWYRGAWAKDTSNQFAMYNSYVRWHPGPLDVLVEYLITRTDADLGVINFYGVGDWKSEGWFLESSYRLVQNSDGREMHVFAGAENTHAQGVGGGSGVEMLSNWKLGLSYRLNENLVFKGQLNRLEYSLPIQISGAADNVGLESNGALVGAVLTF